MSDPDHGIDFVDDEDPGGRDEDLPQLSSGAWRPGTWTRRLRRRRYAVPVLAVAAVVAAVGVVVGGAQLSERHAAGPPSALSSTQVTLNASNGRVVPALPRRTGSDPTRCPGLQCYTTPSVPAAVRAAVRAVFPTARFTAVETIRLVDRADGDPLWYREVVARIGTATLTLRVQAHAAGDLPNGDASDDGSRSVTFLDAQLQQWFVRVQVVDRSGTTDVLAQLGTLTGDRRLLSS